MDNLIIEIKIALRNLIGGYKRTINTMMIIVVGTITLVVAAGYVNFVRVGYAEQIISTSTAHMQIQPVRERLNSNDAYESFLSVDEVEELSDILYEYPDVDFVGRRMDFTGMLSNAAGDKSNFIIGMAGDLDIEMDMSSNNIDAGTYLDINDPYGTVIGRDLAENLNLGVGDSTLLVVPTAGGGIEAILINVAGIANFGVNDLNERMIIFGIEAAQEVLLIDGASRLIVGLNSTDNLEKVYGQFSEELGKSSFNVDALLWSEVDQQYNQVIRLFTKQLRFLSTLMLIIFIISVASSLTMVMLERSTEIGTLRAIGRSKMEILRTIIFESLFMSIISIVLSVLLAELVAYIINDLGIMLPAPPGSTEPTPLGILVSWRIRVQYSIILLLCCVLGALPAAIRGSNINIIKAIKN